MDGRFDPDRTIRVLQQIDADVVGLQEVEQHKVNNLDFLDYVARETEYQAIAGPTLLRKSRHYGNALLTRLPVLNIRRVDLSQPGREPRGALDVTLQGSKHTVRVMATHLGLRPGERREQVRVLLSMLESRSTDVSVLLGDLNEWLLWGQPIRWLRRHFTVSHQPRTYPSFFPLFALDRIWVEPASALIAIEAIHGPLPRTASDHLPLKAVLED